MVQLGYGEEPQPLLGSAKDCAEHAMRILEASNSSLLASGRYVCGYACAFSVGNGAGGGIGSFDKFWEKACLGNVLNDV